MRREGQTALGIISHALSAPLLATPVFVALGLRENAPPLTVILTVLFGTLFPIAGIVGFARLERLDYDIPEKKARPKPFGIAILSYLIGSVILVTIRAPVLLTGLMLAYMINTIAMFLVTLFWKISVLAAGVTGPFSYLLYRLGPAWTFLYLLVIPVGLIRVHLGQHNWAQVIAGAVLGAALTWAQIVFLLPFVPK